MLGKAVFVLAALWVQNGAEPVLRAVGLVGDDHNVGTVGECWKPIFIPFGGKFLHRGKNDSARRPPNEQPSQLLPVLGLLRHFPEQTARSHKSLEQLAV